MPNLRSAISGLPYFKSLTSDIYIYLKSTCHDKQNDGHSFVLRPRIAELWQLKGHNIYKEDRITFFKAGL